MESTWALDVLNILLYDDNSFTFFGLCNMPGLMEAVLEHWRASLIAMFGICEDLELTPEHESRTRKRARCEDAEKRRHWFEKRTSQMLEEAKISEEEEGEFDLGLARGIDPKDKCGVMSGNDFSKRPRFQEDDVEVEEKEDELFVLDNDRNWDRTGEGIELTSEYWKRGGGNTTNHIIAPFAGDLGLVPFVRLLKEIAPPKSDEVEVLVENGKTDQNSDGTSKGPVPKSEPQDEQDHDEDAINEKSPEVEEEDIVDKIKRLTGIVLRDPEAARQRWKEESLEDECYMKDEPSLNLVTDTQESLGKRAICISTILRNLSFVPGNEFEFSKNANFLRIAGHLLLLYHWYPKRAPKQRNYDRGAGADEEAASESCTSLASDTEWWWDYLHVIRENVMVILANISGSLELGHFSEEIVRPILHGLLEWAVSSSSYAQDPFPYVGQNSPVSPQRLAIETICKLCLHETNVDLILTTPPYMRIGKLTKFLAKKLYRYEDQVLREFSINILYYLSAADTGVSRTIATADQTIGLLLGFIEQAEQNAMVVAQQHGVNALRDNPDSMGTSLDMLRRAANTLNNLSRHPNNIPLFVKHEQRLLSLVMSQILDQGVASILSNVLFNIGTEQQKQKAAEALKQQQQEQQPAAAKS